MRPAARATSKPDNRSSLREARRFMFPVKQTSLRWTELIRNLAEMFEQVCSRGFYTRVLAFTFLTLAVHGAPGPAARWWAHVEALANDSMEGRNTGSPAHKRAAEYVAAAFKKAGLEPAGIGGYIQPVAFKTRRIVEAQSSLVLLRNGVS